MLREMIMSNQISEDLEKEKSNGGLLMPMEREAWERILTAKQQ